MNLKPSCFFFPVRFLSELCFWLQDSSLSTLTYTNQIYVFIVILDACLGLQDGGRKGDVAPLIRIARFFSGW